MAIFQRFPTLEYDGRVIRDISRRLYVPDAAKERASVFDLYTVSDGEKIEDVSYKVYGDPEYHWVIMLMNNIIDPFHDWVLSTNELKAYIANNYPGTGNAADAPDGIHHWELDGKIVNSGVVGAVSISNTQYEDRLNEEKRQIKLLRKSFLTRLEDEIVGAIQ